MNTLPLGIPSFFTLANFDFIYVDKTQYIYNLIIKPIPYFLSRPRRFGKSLLLSTIEAIFKGQRDLFQGLWIDGDEVKYDWKPYPVINISLSSVSSENLEKFSSGLKDLLFSRARREGVQIFGQEPSALFRSLIIELQIKYNENVVVLIDEYDAPILNQIENEELANQIRNSLKPFYGVLKDDYSSLRFVFITGVSKFTKTSIFSKLNNLVDLTLDSKFANICGFTEAELIDNFPDYLANSLEYFKNSSFLPLEATQTDLLDHIKNWYDGYSWDGKTQVYNPWSLVNFFNSNDFSNFWFTSGSPSFLVNLLKKKYLSIFSRKITFFLKAPIP